MNVQVECSGQLEKDIYKHREENYPHLIKSGLGAYFLQITKERIDQDRGKNEKE